MLPHTSSLADAIDGYTIQYGPAGLQFKRTEEGLLPSYHRQTVG